MPIIPFESLPDEARVWVFGSDRALDANEAAPLLTAVDRFLAQWKAHGAPLDAARDWRDDRFLIIGVDSTRENASGCSIDGLFRSLQALERSLETKLLGGGRVFYRDESGTTAVATRAEFASLAGSGSVTTTTPVFDMSVTTVAAWRERFEAPAGDAWTKSFF